MDNAMTQASHNDPLRLLFENSPDAMMFFDVGGYRFVDCNRAAVSMMAARDKEQLLRAHPSEIAPEHQPNGKKSDDCVREIIAEVESRGNARFEWLARRFDGDCFHMEVVVTRVCDCSRDLHCIVFHDITSRKQAEAALRESEAKFRLFFEASDDGIFLIDPIKSVYVDCNSAAVRMMRCASKEQLLGVPPGTWSPGKQVEGESSVTTASKALVAVLHKGSQRFDWTARRFDGEEFPMEVLATPMQVGNKLMIMVVCRDITERKQHEAQIQELNQQLEMRIRERTVELVQANEQLKSEIRERRRKELLLQESEARARTLVEFAPEAIVVSDLETGLFVDANENALRLFDMSREEFYKVGVPDVSPRFQPDGRSSAQIAREMLAEALAGETPVFEWTHKNSAGKLIPCEVRLVRYPSTNRNLVRGSVTDITERKRAEAALHESDEKFKLLFDMSPLGMAQVEWDGSFAQVNRSFADMIGYTTEETLKKTYWDITPKEFWPSEHTVLNQIRSTGRFGPYEKEYFHKNGHRVSVVLNGMRVKLADGKETLWSIVENTTERKRAEAELHKSLAREKELSELKTNFVSTVSHEFRTPLGVIMSSSQILADYFDKLTGKERGELLASITKNTRHMAGLMEEVLLLSRVDAGKMACEPARIDLAALCRRVTDEVLSSTSRQCTIDFIFQCDVVEACADERLLRHIFINLLSNAVKYSKPGETVLFTLQRDGGMAVCRIADRGIGIPETDREWLFSAFYRGRNVGERPGTGLGLTIVKRCVELHGGKIEIDSIVNQGTAVTVRLPLFGATDARRTSTEKSA